MRCGLLSLSADTWYEVAELLDIKDIFSLRSVNRQLYQVFSSNRIWRSLSQSRWFSIDDQPSVMLKEVQDCCTYYRNRNRNDLKVQKLITKMARSEDPNEIFEIGWSIIRMNYRAVPILNELRQFKSDLSVRYYAFVLLMSIRHSEAFRAIDALKSSSLNTVTSAEEFFFQMSYIDPAFDDLLPFRKSVIEEVIEKVQCHPSYKETSPASFKVLLIRSVFLNVVQKCSIVKGINCLEDNSILRVYAGEVDGDGLIFQSIIQKIASYFDIKTVLTKSFFIIEDKTFNTGYSYALLDGDRAKVYSRAHVLRTIRLSSEDLDKFLAPVTLNYLIGFIFDSRHDPLYTMFDASLYDKIYRSSQIGAVPDINLMFNMYVRGVLQGVEFSPFSPVAANCASDQMLSKNFVEIVSRSMPFDLIHTQSHLCFQEFFSIEPVKKAIANDYYKFQGFHLQPETREDSTEVYQIGDVIYHERSAKYGIIFGRKCLAGGSVYYNTFTDYGDLTIYESNSIRKIKNVSQDIYHFVTREGWIGMFFTHFDKAENKFVPTKHLLKLYPNL